MTRIIPNLKKDHNQHISKNTVHVAHFQNKLFKNKYLRNVFKFKYFLIEIINYIILNNYNFIISIKKLSQLKIFNFQKLIGLTKVLTRITRIIPYLKNNNNQYVSKNTVHVAHSQNKLFKNKYLETQDFLIKIINYIIFNKVNRIVSRKNYSIIEVLIFHKLIGLTKVLLNITRIIPYLKKNHNQHVSKNTVHVAQSQNELFESKYLRNVFKLKIFNKNNQLYYLQQSKLYYFQKKLQHY